MTVMVYEPIHSGHRLHHVRLLVPALRRAGFSDVVLATTRKALDSEQYGTFVEKMPEKPEIFRLDDSHTRTASDFLSAVASVAPYRVYVPYADGLAQRLGFDHWTRRRKDAVPALEGLQLATRIAYASRLSRDGVYARISWLLSQAYPWDRLHQLDPWASEATQQFSNRLAGEVMPDPVEQSTYDRGAAREHFGLDADSVVIGNFGLLSARKGIEQLVRAFANATDNKRHQLLLAGRLAKDVRELLLHDFAHLVRQGRIRLVNRWLDHAELQMGMSASDWIAALYPDHIGSASLVLRAAAAGRPVIGSDFGWVGRTVDAFGLGHAVDVNQPDLLERTIRESLENPVGLPETEAIDRLLQFHSPENFQATWAARGCEVNGLSAPPVVRWSDVLAAIPSGD